MKVMTAWRDETHKRGRKQRDLAAKERKKWMGRQRRGRRERGHRELSVEGLGGTRWETHAVKQTFQRKGVESDDNLLTPDGRRTHRFRRI